MKTVSRFRLETGRQEVQVREGAAPLDVHYIKDNLYLWCLLDPEARRANMLINVMPTDGDAGTSHVREYVGTAFHPDGPIFHVFWEG